MIVVSLNSRLERKEEGGKGFGVYRKARGRLPPHQRPDHLFGVQDLGLRVEALPAAQLKRATTIF